MAFAIIATYLALGGVFSYQTLPYMYAQARKESLERWSSLYRDPDGQYSREQRKVWYWYLVWGTLIWPVMAMVLGTGVAARAIAKATSATSLSGAMERKMLSKVPDIAEARAKQAEKVARVERAKSRLRINELELATGQPVTRWDDLVDDYGWKKDEAYILHVVKNEALEAGWDLN